MTEFITDWDAVELDYRTGVLDIKEICLKHRITKNELLSAVESRGWTQIIRSPSEEADILARADNYLLDTPAIEPRFPIDSLFSSDEVKKRNLLTVGQVINIHRKDIAQLREISKEMTNRLQNYLVDTGDEENTMKLLKVLGAKEGPSDLLEKISRVLTRLITLEREAYGMTTMMINNDPDEENETNKKIDELRATLTRITQEKAQKE